MVSWRGNTRSSPQSRPMMSIRRRWTKWRASRARIASLSSAPSANSCIEQAQQPVECRLVAAVRRGGEQNEMALAILGKPLEQFEALLPALVRADAGVRFVDHDQSRAGAREAVAAPLGLDVVEADHGERIGIE